MILFTDQARTYAPVLQEIHFGLLGTYNVAGMGEPWIEKMAETHNELRRVGIGAILTLTEDNPYADQHERAGFRICHEPIEDGEAPSVMVLESAVAFIEKNLSVSTGVAVHCLEGRGRTGTVLGAWLAVREGLSGEAAILRLRKLRPFTALSASQKAFLLDYLG